MKKRSLKREIHKYIMLLISNLFLAAALIAFVNNAGIMTGGLGGISIVFENLFPEFEYVTSVVITSLSWIMFFIGWIIKGKNFALKTLFSTITYPLSITLFEYVSNTNHLFPPAVVDGVRDTGLQLVYAILAGVYIGIGLGIAFKVGGSTGGIDIPAIIIAEKYHVSVDKVVFVIDAIIIASGLLVLPFMSVVIGIFSNVV